MATYRPSFVDVSGLTQGITRGLEMAAQRKRQEDALSEARVDDFMKMYQPGKLREIDIPDFTKAYNDYKQSALTYSRLNRGGGKPEDLSIAKANMDKALSGLNNVYSSSVGAANKLAEFGDAIKIARQKGLSVPAEMNQYSQILSSSPISKIDISSIPSAYTYQLLSEDVDYTKLYKDLDVLGAKKSPRVDYIVNKNPMYTFSGKPIYSREKVTTESLDPMSVAAKLPILLADPTYNGLKIQMDKQFNRFKSSDPQTKKDVVDGLRDYFPNIQSESDVTPYMLYSTQLSSTGVTKREEDKSFIDMQVDEIKMRNANLEKAKDRAVQLQGKIDKMDTNQPGHPYNVIQDVRSNLAGTGIKQDVTKEFKRYNLPSSSLGGKEIPQEVIYYPDRDIFTVRTLTGNIGEITPEALESQLVEASGEYKARRVQTTKPTGPVASKKKKIPGFQ
jgi:hypothetical protein